MNTGKLTIRPALARLWRVTAAAWRRYMREHAKTWRMAVRTGHEEAAAASLSQAVMCRRQWALAVRKVQELEAEGRAA